MTAARVIAAFVAGVCLSGAFDPLALPYLAPLAVAALVCLARRQTFRSSIFVGFAFGLGFMSMLLFWLHHSIGYEAWITLSFLEALWFLLMGAGINLVCRIKGWPVWVAALWTTVELARQAWPFGGFPWGRLGYVAVDSPWSGLLPYLGVSVTTFVLALIGTVAVWALPVASRRVGPRIVTLVAVVGASVLPAAFPYMLTETGSLTVAVVQGGVPGRGNEVAANHRQVTRNHVRATLRLAQRVSAGEVVRPDLVVWPENSTAVDPFTDAEANAGIRDAVQQIGVPLLVGALVDVPHGDYLLNQGIVWTPDGSAGDRYTKHHPVPFGEYIPFRSVLGGVSGRLDQVPRDLLAGRGSRPLNINGLKVADAICFDVAYDDVIAPQVRAGARLVVVQTSNATFARTTQLEQQFAITRARALETGRSVVVASINGVSGVISPQGDVMTRAAVGGTDVLVQRVSLRDGVTPAVRWGRGAARDVTGVALIAIALSIGRFVKQRRA